MRWRQLGIPFLLEGGEGSFQSLYRFIDALVEVGRVGSEIECAIAN